MSSAPGAGLHVLVVEDEPVVVELLGEVLDDLGFSSEVATDVAAARRAVERRAPDLVLLDKNLPDDSGLVLARELVGANLAIVVVTGYANLASAIEAMQLGVVDYVVKPFQVHDLVVRLRRVIEMLGLRRANTHLLAELADKNRALEGMVVRDSLTGLYNHAHFHDALEREVERARRHGHVLSVALLDIDGFKEVNDRYGHQVGDHVLRVVARALQGDHESGSFHPRRSDVIARYGGDEIALILPDTDKAGASALGERLRAAVGRESATDGMPPVSLSIGVATCPADATTREALIAAADVALYAAKRGGRNRVVPYTARLIAAGGSETELGRLRALDRTIALGVFHFLYQPIVASGGALFAYEALVRPEDPMLPNPLVLLEVAQRTGKLASLGRAMRTRIASELAALPAGALAFINVHPQELLVDGFGTSEEELAPWSDRIVFEITESAAILEYERVRGVIDALRARGFRFALDDLGAGYAGLNSLAMLAPDFVKLDIDLVRDVAVNARTERLIHHLLEFARGEGMHVIAEGIERDEELAAVRALGVPYFQGYRFGRPARPFVAPIP